MNKVILCGRATKDAEVRYTQGDDSKAVARYTLAVDRRGKDADADFITCVAFGKNGEFAEKYIKKGTKLIIAGHIQTGKYTDKEGKTIYTTDVIVDEHEFAESKKNDSAPAPATDADGFMTIPDGVDEELPFA